MSPRTESLYFSLKPTPTHILRTRQTLPVIGQPIHCTVGPTATLIQYHLTAFC
ncbi:hypothetical protein SCLCIDRAFT_1220746 [Scleroderma citrinum Foug A]|uniref:Uncharacterized protein n=1 Tax=Scleroderma citrinum Foug A TaxID=1036808 RepID=A0A0C3D539_9AGAM|nr:hypothetical protein SCLCIDRAFT_1220746 [Scleroderma citrinum Foug A]